MTCIDPRGHGPFRVFPHPTWSALAIVVAATIAAHVAARAQGSDVKRYNPSEWTKGRFSEVVTVTGAGKTIYLAGVGAEDENAPAGASAPIRHLGKGLRGWTDPGQYVSRDQCARHPGHAARDRRDRGGRKVVLQFDGGTDLIGGALLAFGASGITTPTERASRPRPSRRLRPQTPRLRAAIREDHQ
jgi:hypothetical protein